MRGKWERGIEPRHFTWILKDQLAISERPGGYARNHRKVRRHEEILWLRNHGFTRVVSLLPSPHNLAAYDELEMTWSHFPFPTSVDARQLLGELYPQIMRWLARGEKLLVHQEELNDRVVGLVAGYLRWAGLVDTAPHTVTVIEQIMRRELSAVGRELVEVAGQLPR